MLYFYKGIETKSMLFGKLIKDLRLKKGVSIKKLAPILGLNYTYISKIENSRVSPSPEVLKKMSNYFGYDSDELLIKAGKIPSDVEEIIKNNPREAVAYLRRKFSARAE